MGAKGFAKLDLSRVFGVQAKALDAMHLDGIELVTFDVFDTLVKRACGEPGSVFGIDDSAPWVSVVLPVYNSTAYLPAMLDGLLGERGVPFEVILVDDGSTDGSGELVDSYAARDPRVVAAHQGNSGLCAARNAGLRLARGEYVTFCDDDDLVLAGFVSDNYRVARDADADCVRFGVEHRNIDDGGRALRVRRHVPRKAAVVRAEWMPAHVRGLDYGIQGVWSGLYRTRVIREHGIVFEETFRQGYEDCLFNDEFMVHAKSYALNPNIYYVWMQRNSHSVSTKVTANGFESVRKLLAYEHAMLGESGLLSTSPGYCARRLFRYQNGFLAQGCFEPRREPLQENAIYEMCRESLVPHREVIDVRELDPLTKVLVSCLFNRRYRTLYALVWAGVRAQQVRYRISAVRDAARGGRGFSNDWRSRCTLLSDTCCTPSRLRCARQPVFCP